MLSAVARIVSQPINAWLSLLIALLLQFVKMSGATAPAAAPLRSPNLPFRGRAGVGGSWPGRGSRAAQVSPARAGESGRSRRHPVAGAHGAFGGASPGLGGPRPGRSAGFTRRSPPLCLPPFLSLVKIGLYAEHL